MFIPIPIVSRALGGSASLYAVGENGNLARQAAENTFLQLGWPSNWDKKGRLIYYPGGLLDRAGSAYLRATTWGGTYEADAIWIEIYATNNPLVSLVKTRLHLKTGGMIQWKKPLQKKQERANAFYEALVNEFRKLELSLVQAEDWNDLVAKAPLFRCSPVWESHYLGESRYWKRVPAN